MSVIGGMIATPLSEHSCRPQGVVLIVEFSNAKPFLCK